MALSVKRKLFSVNSGFRNYSPHPAMAPSSEPSRQLSLPSHNIVYIATHCLDELHSPMCGFGNFSFKQASHILTRFPILSHNRYERIRYLVPRVKFISIALVSVVVWYHTNSFECHDNIGFGRIKLSTSFWFSSCGGFHDMRTCESSKGTCCLVFKVLNWSSCH